MSDIPLTPEQSIFAAENHDLVLKFLRQRRLAMNDYYDVIVFGYLDAVRRYFMNKELQKYKFSTIAWQGMDGALANYRKSLTRKKRNADVVSIHSELYNDGPVLENTLPVYHDLLARLQTELLLHDLATVVSKQQMDMVRMRSHGYNIREIARRHNVPMQDVKMLLAGACAALKQLCYEY